MLVHPSLRDKTIHKSVLLPHFIASSVADINFSYLHSLGILAGLIDLDGTVVERGTYSVSPKTIEVLKRQPLQCYIATNRPRRRELKNLKDDLHAKGVIHPSGLYVKPLKRYYGRGLAQFGLQPAQSIMIGDRLLQDIIGGNHAGLYTLAVYKLGATHKTFDKLLTGLEQKFISAISQHYFEV